MSRHVVATTGRARAAGRACEPSEWVETKYLDLIHTDDRKKGRVNVSILPIDMMLDEEEAEKSCWETSSLESLAKLKLDFTFVHGLEQVAAAEDSHIVPCDIAYHPTRCQNRQAI